MGGMAATLGVLASGEAMASVHDGALLASIPSRHRKVASAPKVTTQTTTRDLPVEEDQSGTAISLFLGAGGSYYSVVSRGANGGEPDKSGMGYQGKAGLTLYNRSLALELNAGWMRSSVASKQASVATVGNTTSTTSVQVDTQVGMVEFSPRFRLGEHFELGPSAGVFFGANASFGATASQPDSPVMGGLKAAATWQTRELHFRVVAQAQTSLTIPERRVMMGSLGLEIGLPLLKGKTIVRETQVREVEERHSVEYVETEVPVIQKVEVVKEVLREVVLFSFDDQVVHFEFDRARLSPGSDEFVSRLGAYLGQNPDLWESLRIEGHTDSVGTPEYNVRLSEARATAVRQVLARSGVAEDKIASRGLGMASPLDRGPSDLSRARNRRVEFSFTGVKDAKALRDAINRIRFETAMPATCRGDGRCR